METIPPDYRHCLFSTFETLFQIIYIVEIRVKTLITKVQFAYYFLCLVQYL